jgi:rubrerythrin
MTLAGAMPHRHRGCGPAAHRFETARGEGLPITFQGKPPMHHFRLDPDMAMAFAELSAMAARNRLFCLKAKAEGRRDAALILSAMAESEEIMARRAMIALRGKAGDLADYLSAAADYLQEAASKRLVQRAADASAGGDASAAEIYGRFGAVTANHRGLLDTDTESLSSLYVCQVCGYIAADEIPARCPVCNAVAKKFRAHGM